MTPWIIILVFYIVGIPIFAGFVYGLGEEALVKSLLLGLFWPVLVPFMIIAVVAYVLFLCGRWVGEQF